MALNPAEEAARATETGAGFAVAADEARNLAMRVADAAKHTASLIESTVYKAKDGTSLVNKTNEDFSLVAQSSDSVPVLVDKIAVSSGAQALDIDTLNIAMTEMDKVAAHAEESAHASEEMNAQAGKIKYIVQDLKKLAGGCDVENHALT